MTLCGVWPDYHDDMLGIMFLSGGMRNSLPSNRRVTGSILCPRQVHIEVSYHTPRVDRDTVASIKVVLDGFTLVNHVVKTAQSFHSRLDVSVLTNIQPVKIVCICNVCYNTFSVYSMQ